MLDFGLRCRSPEQKVKRGRQVEDHPVPGEAAHQIASDRVIILFGQRSDEFPVVHKDKLPIPNFGCAAFLEDEESEVHERIGEREFHQYWRPARANRQEFVPTSRSGAEQLSLSQDERNKDDEYAEMQYPEERMVARDRRLFRKECEDVHRSCCCE